MKVIVIGILLPVLALVGFTGCGTRESSTSEYGILGKIDERYLTRFSEAEAISLEDSAFRTTAFGPGSSKVPSKALSAELGVYTIAAEAKVYLPFSRTQTETKPDIIRLNEKVSGLTNIVDANGNHLYSSATPVNSRGVPSPEESDGAAPSTGEDHYVSIVMSAAGMDLKGIIKATVADDNGLLRLDLTNSTKLTTQIVFTLTVVEVAGMFAKTELYPYKNGYLVYSIMKIKGANSTVEQKMTADMLPPNQIATINYFRTVKWDSPRTQF